MTRINPACTLYACIVCMPSMWTFLGESLSFICFVLVETTVSGKSLAHCLYFVLVRELPGKVPWQKIPSELGSLTLFQTTFFREANPWMISLGMTRQPTVELKAIGHTLQSLFSNIRRGNFTGFPPLPPALLFHSSASSTSWCRRVKICSLS